MAGIRLLLLACLTTQALPSGSITTAAKIKFAAVNSDKYSCANQGHSWLRLAGGGDGQEMDSHEDAPNSVLDSNDNMDKDLWTAIAAGKNSQQQELPASIQRAVEQVHSVLLACCLPEFLHMLARHAGLLSALKTILLESVVCYCDRIHSSVTSRLLIALDACVKPGIRGPHPRFSGQTCLDQSQLRKCCLGFFP